MESSKNKIEKEAWINGVDWQLSKGRSGETGLKKLKRLAKTIYAYPMDIQQCGDGEREGGLEGYRVGGWGHL